MKIEYLSYNEIEELNFNNTILFLPIGPFEQHGPHLPISTDIIIAKFLAESVCETLRLEKKEIQCIEAPAITYTPVHISDGIGLTPKLTNETFIKMLSEILLNYIEMGFNKIILITHHFELNHIKNIILAISNCESKISNKNVKIIEPLSAYYYSGEYNNEIYNLIKSKQNSNTKYDEIIKGYKDIDFSREIHADIKETSLIMYLLPKTLKKDKLADLQPYLVNPTIEFLKLNFTFKKMGANLGYIGTPNRASIFLGELIFKQLCNCIINSLNCLINNKPQPYSIPIHIKAILAIM